MEYTIVVKEVKEVYHEIKVDVDNDKPINKVAEKINMGDFYDIEEVADYIDEFMPVCSVDDYYEEVSKSFWCEEIYCDEI